MTRSALALAVSNIADLLPPEFGHVRFVSRLSGILSLTVWLFAQLPQVLENYRNQSVSGISPAFLFCWISGDVSNFVGCLLTKALPFQTCLAAYYCFIDLILALQYWYYTQVYPKQTVHHNMLQSPNMMRPVASKASIKDMILSRVNRFEASPLPHRLSAQRSNSLGERRSWGRPRRSFFKLILSSSVLSRSFGKASAYPTTSADHHVHDPSKSASWVHRLYSAGVIVMTHLLKVPLSASLLGTYIGWLSTCFYVLSRIPQMVKNHRSKSTSGISPLLFVFALSGNVLYTVSVSCDLFLLLKYKEYLGAANFSDLLTAQLPFLVGTSGTVLFDMALLFQFWLYSDPRGQHDLRDLHDVCEPHDPHDPHDPRDLRDLRDPHHPYDPHGPYHTLEIEESRHLGNLPVPILASMADDSIHTVKETVAPGDLHFTKPDWYTNIYHNVVPDSSLSYEERQQNTRLREILEMQNRQPWPKEHIQPVCYPYIVSPPSHYVVSGSQSTTTNPQSSERRGRGLLGAFNALTKSGSNTPTNRLPLVNSPGVFGPQSALSTTALLPSVVGNYSSISKKMTHEAKVPFLPIDFLHDGFLHRSGSPSHTQRHMGPNNPY